MFRLGAAILSPLISKPDNTDDQSRASHSHGQPSARSAATPVYTSISGQEVEAPEQPEDFARDAKIELMKRATEDLKAATLDAERSQVK